MKFKIRESKRQRWIDSVGLYAIVSYRYTNGRVVRVKKDKHGLYWDEDWQKSRVEDEEDLTCWKLEE